MKLVYENVKIESSRTLRYGITFTTYVHRQMLGKWDKLLWHYLLNRWCGYGYWHILKIFI